MKRRLIIFAKEPQIGRVKTRLADYLPASLCVNLYKAFLKDTIDLARSARCDENIIAYESKTGDPNYLRKIAGRGFKFYRQKGRDLGEKMYNAFEMSGKNGNYKTVIIGSDSPTLPPRFIKQAFRRLSKSSVVLGPSRDGGYYLIGLKKPCAGIFKNIRWSSNTVLEDTVNRARACRKDISLLEEWYDVDSKEALDCLECDLKNEKAEKRAKWTRKFLKI